MTEPTTPQSDTPPTEETAAAPTPAPAPPEEAAAPTATASAWEGGGAASAENVDLLKSAFLGVTLTALIYEVYPLPFLTDGRISAVFDNTISELILGMTLWSLFLLLFKGLRHRAERRAWAAYHASRVPAVLERGVYAREAEKHITLLESELTAQKVKRPRATVVFRRLARLMRFIRTVPRKDGLNEFLDYQGQMEQKKLETSYTILQVFIWAIPILGFIGTVLGIGEAVSEFATFIQTAEGTQLSNQMRAALGGVTSGLAVAFNTTFLALVLVIPVMLITSFLQKAEEGFLVELEEYLLEHLLPHLHVTPSEHPVSERFDDHLTRIIQLSDVWLSQLEPLVGRITREVEMLSHQLAGVQPLIKDFTDRLLPDTPAEPAEPVAAADAEPAAGGTAERQEPS